MGGRSRIRTPWRRALAVGAAALALAAVASAESDARAAGPARGRAAGCGAHGLVCSVVDVPLDRTGTVPGAISLHVEVLPSEKPPKGTVFLVAGGPGQGSAETFELGDPEQAAFFRLLFPGYTLVAYDDRGTGRSGPLDCRALEEVTVVSDPAQVVADCAAELGSAAAFYGTRDHAEDLEAVRASLGVDRIAILGVSYGTHLAVAYAAAHPEHVERLVLDSVEAPGHDAAFPTDVLRALPHTLARYCAGGLCDRAARDYPADVAAVANRLAASPEPGGPTALGLLGLVLSADVDPGVAAELPAAVHAARAGDLRPLRPCSGSPGRRRSPPASGSAGRSTSPPSATAGPSRGSPTPRSRTARRRSRARSTHSRRDRSGPSARGPPTSATAASAPAGPRPERRRCRPLPCRTCRCWPSRAGSTCARRSPARPPWWRASRTARCSCPRASATAC